MWIHIAVCDWVCMVYVASCRRVRTDLYWQFTIGCVQVHVAGCCWICTDLYWQFVILPLWIDIAVCYLTCMDSSSSLSVWAMYTDCSDKFCWKTRFWIQQQKKFNITINWILWAIIEQALNRKSVYKENWLSYKDKSHTTCHV